MRFVKGGVKGRGCEASVRATKGPHTLHPQSCNYQSISYVNVCDMVYQYATDVPALIWAEQCITR
jgi:hypothetical protein